MSLGDNIRRYRGEKQLTQEALAAMLTVSPQAVSKWERNDSMPDAAMLPALADALGVSIDRLYGRTARSDEDLLNAVAAYMGKETDRSWFERLRQLAYAAAYGERSLTPHYGQSACITASGGFTFDSLRKELPFALIFPEPEEGWRKVIYPDEKVQRLLAILADADCVRVLLGLHEQVSGFSFDESWAAEQFGLTDASAMLEQLRPTRTLSHSDVTVNGESIVIWRFTPQPAVLALLSIADELVNHAQHYDHSETRREKPLLG